jgi:hypothetical protein
MMKVLSLVLAAVWLVGQVSAFSSSDNPSLLSKTDNNNEDNIIIGSLVESKRVTILHQSDTTQFTLKEQRHLQSLDDQACDGLKDELLSDNAGAICLCSKSENTYTCVHPAKCVDETLTTCGGNGEICEVLTKVYSWTIQGSTVTATLQRFVVVYTGGHLSSEEIEVVSKGQCEYYMTTLDGRRYQCNDCSIFDCPDGETNVDCSNVQADSTTNGQCVSLKSTTVDLGLLNKFCDDKPVRPTTLAAVAPANARSWSTGNYFLWYKNNAVVLATIMALLTFSMWMI